MINVRRSNELLVMLYNEWKMLTNENRPLNIEWNIMHMFSSSQLAKLYAINKNLDIELCAIIAILHDIAVVEGRIRKNHDKIAGKYVLGVIERFNNKCDDNTNQINDIEVSIIINAIIGHSDKDNFIDDEYAEMLKNIDCVDRYLYGIDTDGSYLDRCKEFMNDLNLII